MAITYLGDCAAWKQITPPAWDKSYVGETDKCTIVYQGPQYLETAFLSALTKFQTMVTVAGLNVVDERGNSRGDIHMWLTHASSDESAVMPKVTCTFEGCRGGTTPDYLATDDITNQSASTNYSFTSGVNDGHTVTLAISYKAARTSYDWVQLSDPAGTATYATVRNELSYSQPPSDANISGYKYSGMVDAAGDPTGSISTGDATAVWNTFTFNTVVTLNSAEAVPGKVWKCKSTADFLIIGT